MQGGFVCQVRVTFFFRLYSSFATPFDIHGGSHV